MAVTMCLLVLALYPYMITASADIRFRLDEFTLTSNYTLMPLCCGQEPVNTPGCLSICPYRLKLCIGPKERHKCSLDYPLDKLNPGSDVIHISLEYIKTRTELHVLLVTDTSEEDILSDALFLSAGTNRMMSGKCQNNYQCSLKASITVNCESDFYGEDCAIYCVPPQNCSQHLHKKDMYMTSDVHRSIRAVTNTRIITCSQTPNSCRNFGTCVAGVCQCIPGFTGDLCEIDILECDTNPCVHGRCIEPNEPNKYSCECDAGYTGTNCTVRTNATAALTCPECYYNGSCHSKPVTSANDRSQGCPAHQYGTNCNVTCVPQNTCDGGHYECNPTTGERDCHGGWSGDNCTVRNVSKSCDSECPNVRCKNDGTCFNGACCCLPKYTGKYCERVKIFCDQSPCKNSGTCTNTEEGYSCRCRQGYGGINCENIVTTLPTTVSTPAPVRTSTPKAPTIPSTKLSPTPNPTTATKRTTIKLTTTQPTPKPTTTAKPTTTSNNPTTSTSTTTSKPTATHKLTTTLKPTIPKPTTPKPTPTSTPTTSKPTTPKPTTSKPTPTSTPTTSKPTTPKPTTPKPTTPKPITTTVITTTDEPTTTAKPLVTHNLLVNGKINDKDIQTFEKLFNDVLKNLNCTTGAKIIDFHHLINDNSEQVTSLDFTSDCIHGNTLDPKVVHMLNTLFERTEPFRSASNHIFGQQMSPLKDLAQSYSLNLIGYVYDQNEDAINRKIVNTWSTSSHIPDIKVLIVLREFFVGSYGTHVTRLRYFVTSHFRLLDPQAAPSPTTSAFEVEFNKAPVVNSIYTGHALYMYTDGIRLPVLDLTSPVTSLASPLAKVWSDFLNLNNATPRKARNIDVEIILSGREPCFSGNRTDLQSSVYFPVLANNSLLTYDLRHVPDTHSVVTTTCRTCLVVQRQFYIDLTGRLLLRDRDAVYRVIREAWGTTQNANQLIFTEKQYFHDNNGELVTRLWYTHPLGPSDQYTEWPHPNIGGRWDNISRNLVGHTPNTLRVERIYRLVLQDNVPQTRMSEISQKLHQAWTEANRHVSADEMQLNIVAWSSNYVSAQGGIVTRIDYKVSVANGDSSDVGVESPDKSRVIRILGKLSLRVCVCLVYKQRHIGVVGNIGTNDAQAVENAISTVWESTNPGLSLDISGHVKSILAGYQSQAGEKATKVVYYAVPFIHGTPIDEDDLDTPTVADIKIQVEAALPGITVEEHPLVKASTAEDADEKPSWLIPVAVAAGVVGFLLVMAVITAIIKRHSHKKSKTLNQNPERVEGYDKEHFSTAPDLDNSLNVDDPQWMENEKHKTYVVNM